MARFTLPAGAQEARLCSRTFVPREFEHDCCDRRHLGVPPRSVRLFDGLALDHLVPIDHPALAGGFHDAKRASPHGWRWTDGAAVLAPELWAGTRTDFYLRVELTDIAYFRMWMLPHLAAPAEAIDLAAYRFRAA